MDVAQHRLDPVEPTERETGPLVPFVVDAYAVATPIPMSTPKALAGTACPLRGRGTRAHRGARVGAFSPALIVIPIARHGARAHRARLRDALGAGRWAPPKVTIIGGALNEARAVPAVSCSEPGRKVVASPPMRVTAAGLAAVVALAAIRVVPARSDYVVADTAVAAVTGQYYSAPLLAVDPVDGEPHLGFTAAGAVHHAWRSAGTWSREVVAPAGGSVDFVLSPSGVPHATFLLAGGVVAHARRQGGTWVEDTVAVMAGTLMRPVLALDPATEEPAVAMLVSPGADSVVLWLARHGPGGWASVVVDTGGSSSATALALAVDAGGRPLIAWARNAVTGPRGLLLTTGAGPSGPFTSDVADTGFTLHAALALDPATGAPRLAHYSVRTNGEFDEQRLFYSWRHVSAGWQHVEIPVLVPDFPRPVSLVLDPLGDPVVATTVFYAIQPYRVKRVEGGCGLFENGALDVWSRVGGTGAQEFTRWASLSAANGSLRSSLASVRAIASTGVGDLQTAWRDPHYNATYCYPDLFWYAVTHEVAVSPAASPSVLLAPPAPNPWTGGRALTVVFSLPRPGAAALELHDVAGRRIARHDAGMLGAGPHVRAWHPGPLAPGVYRLSLQLDGARLAQRTLVVTR